MQIEVRENKKVYDVNLGDVNRSITVYVSLGTFNIWSIHTSRCIIVLNVLLEDYTTAYACC